LVIPSPPGFETVAAALLGTFSLERSIAERRSRRSLDDDENYTALMMRFSSEFRRSTDDTVGDAVADANDERATSTEHGPRRSSSTNEACHVPGPERASMTIFDIVYGYRR